MQYEPEVKKTYDRYDLNMRAAEFYRGMRKPAGDWRTIDDLRPHLSEFDHYIAARAYDRAFDVLQEIASHLFVWGQYAKTEKMRSLLRGHLEDPVKEVINTGRLGKIYMYLGRMNDALQCLETAVADADRLGETKHKGRYLGEIGVAKCLMGKVEDGAANLEQARLTAHQTGDRLYEAHWLYTLGWVSINFQRDAANAEKYTGQATKIFDQLAESEQLDVWILSHYGQCSAALGQAYNALGQDGRAREFLDRAAESARKANDLMGRLCALSHIGRIHRCGFQPGEAMKHYTQSLEYCEKIGARIIQVQNIGRIGDLYRDRGFLKTITGEHRQAKAAFQTAAKFYDEGIEKGEPLGLDNYIRLFYTRKGNVYHELGYQDASMFDIAAGCYDSAARVAEHESPAAQVHALLHKGWLANSMGRWERSGAFFEAALAHVPGIQDDREKYELEARASFGLGVILLTGKTSGTVTAYRNAGEAFEEVCRRCEQWHNRLNQAEILQKSRALYLQAAALAGRAAYLLRGDQYNRTRRQAEETLIKAFATYKAPNCLRDVYRDLREIQGASEQAAELVHPFIRLIRDELLKSTAGKSQDLPGD
jgi:tetratricopeptide (TPR) repeat protein